MPIKKWIWIALGLFAIILRWILGNYPIVIEQYYSRGVFSLVRYGIDYSLALLPVPLLYLFVPTLLVILFLKIRTFFKIKKNWKAKLLDGLLGVLSFIGGGIFFFLFLWGFNYGRVPIEQQLSINPQPLSLEELKEELDLATERLIQYQEAIPEVYETTLTVVLLPENFESVLRSNLKRWLQEHDFPTPGRVRGRTLLPKGIFLHFSSSGLYFPFTGEGHIDGGLLDLQKPFVLTHEMAHGYGFTDEGTCNFIAYLACTSSDIPVLKYSGQMAYYRYLASSYLRYKPKEYRKFRAALPTSIQGDLNTINENLDRYPDLMPELRYYAYDAYLKSQGISEGMKNYSRINMLGRAWRLKREGRGNERVIE